MMELSKTPNTTVNGLELDLLLKNKQLLLLPHKTHCTQTNFLSTPSPESELQDMTDLKLMVIMMELSKTLNMTANGLLPSPKPPHLLLHKTLFTPMNFHSTPSPDQELQDTIDPKLTATTMELSKTPNTTA